MRDNWFICYTKCRSCVLSIFPYDLSLFFRLLNVKILRIKKNREVIIKYFAKFDFCNRKREALFTRY